MAEVSIITPAYNAENFLPETIDSVLNQTFRDWELIVVDDCSTDRTFEIASAYAEKDPRVRVIRNESNSGVAATRNHGLDEATGDYIAFVDSDDLWLPEKLEKQLRFMKEKGVAFSYTAYQKYVTETKERGKVLRAPAKMTAKKILGNTAIGCLTVMVDRKTVGDFRMPLLPHTEDNCTWQEILSRGYVGYGIPEVLSLYRISDRSMTSDKSRAAKQQWETYRKHYKFSIVKSAYYFTKYAVHAVIKHF